MIHKNTDFFEIFIFSLIFFVTFFFSIYQLNVQYDGHHHGIILSITESFTRGEVPYKDFLPNFGIFFIFINSFFFKIFNNSIFGIYFLISIVKALSTIILALIIKKKFGKKEGINSLLIIFFLQPFVETPWPDYVFFIFLLISIYLVFFYNNFITTFCSGIFYSLAGLTKDNFMIILFFSVIIFLIIFLFLKLYRKKKIIFDFNILIWFLGYLIPIISFFLYLDKNNIVSDYLTHFKLGGLAIQYYCPSIQSNFILRIFDCGFIQIYELFVKSFSKLLTEPYWFFFLLLIVVNTLFLIHTIFFHKKIIQFNQVIILFISLISLLLFSNNLYFLTVQRLSTGVLLGLVTFYFLLKKIISPVDRYIILTLLLLFLLNGFQLARTSNNPIYPTFSKKISNLENKIPSLKYKKLSEFEWKQLLELDYISKDIKQKCEYIKYSTNLTNDVYYRVILNSYFEVINYIPYGIRNQFQAKMYNNFDKNYLFSIDQKIGKNNLLLVIDERSSLIKEFLKNKNLYLFKSIKYYNYGTNYINVLLPKKCKL